MKGRMKYLGKFLKLVGQIVGLLAGALALWLLIGALLVPSVTPPGAQGFSLGFLAMTTLTCGWFSLGGYWMRSPIPPLCTALLLSLLVAQVPFIDSRSVLRVARLGYWPVYRPAYATFPFLVALFFLASRWGRKIRNSRLP